MSNTNRQSHASQGVPQTHILGRRLMACAMSALLVTATPLDAAKAYAEETTTTSKDGSTSNATSTASKTSSSTSAKDEIVYAKADATGSDTGLYVVNYFNTSSAEDVTDPGSYVKLTNLSSTQTLTESDGSVNLTTLAGEPFYYQGDLSTSTTLPWDVEITYTLDGKEVSPDDLAGKDGDLDIELKITGLDDDSATADFAKSFL
ncbi:MAG: hypothetical protein ACRC75_10935, partial [Olsenella sp.]